MSYEEQNKLYYYVKSKYDMPIGELCQEVNNNKGEICHPLLYSVLCARVNVNEKENNRTLKKVRKININNNRIREMKENDKF